MPVSDKIQSLQKELPATTRLVAVSKFHPVEAILEAYIAGQRIFGENRVQELCEKVPVCPKDIEWHLIGHLQTNKIKQVVPFVALIQSADSFNLLKAVNKEAEKIGKIVPCLLQIHIAQEETKFGFSFEECREMLNTKSWKELKFIRLDGLMGMASLTDNQAQIHAEFKSLKTFFDEIKGKYFSDNTTFCELSMGMSDDYKIAIEEGSTLVRIGSSIFGPRVY